MQDRLKSKTKYVWALCKFHVALLHPGQNQGHLLLHQIMPVDESQNMSKRLIFRKIGPESSD